MIIDVVASQVKIIMHHYVIHCLHVYDLFKTSLLLFNLSMPRRHYFVSLPRVNIAGMMNYLPQVNITGIMKCVSSVKLHSCLLCHRHLLCMPWMLYRILIVINNRTLCNRILM